MRVALSSAGVVAQTILALAFLNRFRSLTQGPRSTFRRLCSLRRFDDSTDMFPDHAYGPAFSSSKPYARAVVCIGGFGDSPASFSPLIKEISGGGTVSGGGTIMLTPSTYGWHKWDHFHSARTLSYKDWVRDCLRELRLANTLSDDVTVVAHSTGVLPVVFCLSKLETAGADRLVFTGSNLKPSKSDLSSKRLLLSPVGRLIRFVLPVIPKKLRKGPNGKLRPVDTINEEYHRNGFYLKAFPLNAGEERQDGAPCFAPLPTP